MKRAIGRLVLTLLPAAGLLFPVDSRSQDHSVESALRDSGAAYLRGDYRNAARILEDAFADPRAGASVANAGLRGRAALAELLRLTGRYAEAEGLARTIVAAHERTPDGADELARSLLRLATILKDQGRYDRASEALLRALGLLESRHGMDHPDAGEVLHVLGSIAALQDRLDDAARYFWRAQMVRTYLLGADSTAVGETLEGLAGVYSRQGRRTEADALYLKSLAIAEKPPRNDKAWTRLDDRDLRQLIPPQRETVATRGLMSTQTVGPRDLEHGRHYETLARLYRAAGRTDDAEFMYRRAIGIRERALGGEHPDVIQPLAELADIQRERGQVSQALERTRALAELAARRIAAQASVGAEQVLGEQRRWRGLFLLQLELVSRLPGRTDEAFVAAQYAMPGAAESPIMSTSGARGALAPDEALVVTTGGPLARYAVVVLADRSSLLRAPGARELNELIRRETVGHSRVFLLADDDAGYEGAHSALQSVGGLRRRIR